MGRKYILLAMNSLMKNFFEDLLSKVKVYQARHRDNLASQKEREQKLLDAAAMATLFSSKKVRGSQKLIAPFCDEPFLPSSKKLIEIAPLAAIKKRIAMGHLPIKGPWNGNFIYGLKSSGANREDTGR